MMKEYTSPKLNLVDFDDVIATSDGSDWNNSGGIISGGDSGWSDDR